MFLQKKMELKILAITSVSAHEHRWAFDSYSFCVSLEPGSSVEHMPWPLKSQLFEPLLNPRDVISSNTGGNIGSIGLTRIQGVNLLIGHPTRDASKMNFDGPPSSYDVLTFEPHSPE